MLGNYLYIDGGEQTVTGDSTDGTVSQTIRVPSYKLILDVLVHANS